MTLARPRLSRARRAAPFVFAAMLAGGVAQAQTTGRAQPVIAPGAMDFAFPYPAEGTNILASAKAAMAPCAVGAVSQTWHMSCTLDAVWGSGYDHRNHPPAHSAAFISAAMAEAIAQTRRYNTREHQVYRQLARQFSGTRQDVSYMAFLDAAGRVFRQIPRPAPVPLRAVGIAQSAAQ
jgi:hypothetical protein